MNLKSREEELNSIMRYENFTSTMFYRASVLTHCWKVHALVKQMSEEISEEFFDKKLTNTLALIHDDTEIIVGDILAQNKDNFSQAQKQEYEEKCNQAIPILVQNYSEFIEGFNYRELLELEEKNNTAECALVKFADKVDAYHEVCHEILAGNKEFLKEVTIKGITYSPYQYTYDKMIRALNHLKQFIDTSQLSLVNAIEYHPNFNEFCEEGILHTRESLLKKQPLKSYQLWIETIKNIGGEELFKTLYTKNE